LDGLKILETISRDLGPLSLTIPIAAILDAVEMAAIVEVDSFIIVRSCFIT